MYVGSKFYSYVIFRHCDFDQTINDALQVCFFLLPRNCYLIICIASWFSIHCEQDHGHQVILGIADYFVLQDRNFKYWTNCAFTRLLTDNYMGAKVKSISRDIKAIVICSLTAVLIYVAQFLLRTSDFKHLRESSKASNWSCGAPDPVYPRCFVRYLLWTIKASSPHSHHKSWRPKGKVPALIIKIKRMMLFFVCVLNKTSINT